MRFRWTFGCTFLVAMIVAGQSEAAVGRLEALTARRDLCDLICYAMADGSVSNFERKIILTEAKDVLTSEEYVSFKKTLDRISPPKKPKKTPAKLAKTTRNKKPTSPALPPQTVEAETGPVIPTGASLPDRVAPPLFFR